MSSIFLLKWYPHKELTAQLRIKFATTKEAAGALQATIVAEKHSGSAQPVNELAMCQEYVLNMF